jgi:hypothetical protein
MKWSTIISLVAMLYGNSTTAILALTSPLAQRHPLITVLALLGGFLGTSIFFTNLTRSEYLKV